MQMINWQPYDSIKQIVRCSPDDQQTSPDADTDADSDADGDADEECVDAADAPSTGLNDWLNKMKY